MKKSNLLVLCMVLLFSRSVFSQNIEECRKVVDIVLSAVNNQSSEKLQGYLADDFQIAGQKGDVAKEVLGQLFSLMGETVVGSNEMQSNIKSNSLKLQYNIEYEKMGSTEAYFIFNEDNLLKELHLFEMEVKQMTNDMEVIESSEDVITIPFERAGNLILVDVYLNGEKRKFILDTGAPAVILNANHLSKQDSTEKVLSSSQGAGGRISNMGIEQVKEIDFYGIKLQEQDLVTIDLQHLEEALDCEFYGLIGYDLIKNYDILFDYKKQVITLINPDQFKTYKQENLAKFTTKTIPFALNGHIPVVKGVVNGITLSFGLDSGAESNLIDDDLLDSLKSSTSKLKTDYLSGADTNKVEVVNGNIKKLEIGEKTFKKVSTSYSDISHLNHGYHLNLDGLIGYPVLSKQKTLISFKRQELLFIE